MTNNHFPTADQVEQVRRQYPKGTRIELVQMHDAQAPPQGTKGIVDGVDDIGSILVAWDNGSRLNVAFGEDVVRRLPGMSETVKEQVLFLRNTGLTNMLDTVMVQQLAFDHGYHELVNYIKTDSKAYVTFIMFGDAK